MTIGDLPQVCLTVGTMDPQIYPIVIYPVLECINGIDTVISWQNPHNGSLTCGVRVTMVGKAH